MLISVVIPSRWSIEVFENILNSLEKQTLKDFEVILVLDKIFDSKSGLETWETEVKSKFKDLNLTILCNMNYNGEWKQNNASFLRNVGIKKAKWEFINIFDDDIVFENDYLEKSLKYINELGQANGEDVLVAPTMMYRKSNIIQSQWFSYFSFWLCRPVAYSLWNKEYAKIWMFSWNSLFGKAEIFKKILFDEFFDFVNEDLDFTYRISKKYDIFLLRNLSVNHMEREKTMLDVLWIWNEYQAYNRAKHRIIFVRKNGTWREKVIAYSVWLLGNNLWLMYRIFKYGKSPEKFGILRAFVKWIWDWIWFRF